MTTFDSLYDWVLPDLPMVPHVVALNAIRDAVIDFCERTLLYRYELQQILVLPPTSTTTTASAISGATSVLVSSISNFNDLDTITVDLSDGTKWRGHVSGTPSGSTINLDGALNQSVDSGATVTKLVYLYPITLPTGTSIAKGLAAYLNDSFIEPISMDDLDNEFNSNGFGWIGVNWRTDINLPTRWYFRDDTTVGLALASNATGNLRIEAALKPSRASTSFPTWIFERYVETIAHGAKARLMCIAKKPYTDLQACAYHEGMYNSLVAEAKVRASRANTRAPLRTHTVFSLR